MEIGGILISEIPRDEFLKHYWSYQAGDHVTFIAPTGWGKTTFCLQLVEHTASPKLPVFNLAGKPKDAAMLEFTKKLKLRLVKRWPAPWSPLAPRKPVGYTIWPPHTGNEEIDDVVHAEAFRRVMRERAAKGNSILNCDEFGELKELGLDKTTRAIHRRGRSNGCGIWGGIQGPTHAETNAYSQAMHLFLGATSDERHRKRFGEIGGVDPKLVEAIVARLPDHHWLYIRRRGRVMCIVGP